MASHKTTIINEKGETIEASAPIIVSASRSTDIPAFYCDWFFDRLRKGYSVWTNPFNGVPSYISYQDTRFIVFWSKNPRPLLGHLDELDSRSIGCYVQFTLNDYENEGLEKGVPPLAQRIDTFKQFVARLGRGRVIWRFDPMILTDKISIDDLLKKVKNIGICQFFHRMLRVGSSILLHDLDLRAFWQTHSWNQNPIPYSLSYYDQDLP